MKDFKTYEEARGYAQAEANRLLISYGIEKFSGGLPGFGPWTVKMLPRKENRYGWELRCEAVEPERFVAPRLPSSPKPAPPAQPKLDTPELLDAALEAAVSKGASYDRTREAQERPDHREPRRAAPRGLADRGRTRNSER